MTEAIQSSPLSFLAQAILTGLTKLRLRHGDAILKPLYELPRAAFRGFPIVRKVIVPGANDTDPVAVAAPNNQVLARESQFTRGSGKICSGWLVVFRGDRTMQWAAKALARATGPDADVEEFKAVAIFCGTGLSRKPDDHSDA